ncbi:MAG TPA: hypothetical protein VJ183_18020 [Chloroflexia bacterium]|nr:hypothetical protein [Chloroflexia bacterium]
MYGPLLIIAISAVLCLALGLVPRWAGAGRVIAPLGMAASLGVALWREGLEGGRVAGRVVAWPQWVHWLGEPIYRTDPLSAGLGAWCLILGGLCLLKMAVDGDSSWHLAISALTIGVLYSLVHTDNLLAFAGQTLGLVLLAWGYHVMGEEIEDASAYGKHLFALGMGAVLLLGAVLLMGRTTGGDYSLVRMSLSALTVWPLVLLTGFVVMWSGLLPFTGWSAEGRRGASAALVQSLLVGLPVLMLLLRLEGLLSAQALVGTLPGQWLAFTGALAWLGGLTALVAAAGMLVWAGTAHWTAMLTAHAMGLVLWGLGLDTPTGRYGALAMLLAYGAGRVASEMVRGEERSPQGSIAVASLGAAPLTVGFVGVWLLGAALAEAGRPTLVVALAGIAIIAASGVVLNVVLAPRSESKTGRWAEYTRLVGIAGASLLVLGGVLPGIWLSLVGSMATIAGGDPNLTSNWVGLNAESASTPLLLMLVGVVVVLGLGWVVAALTRARATSSGTLLPTALEHLAKGQVSKATLLRPLLTNPPAAAWWLSLAWLDAGILRAGSLLGRLGTRSGTLLGRLEGRFYLPLAIILALLLVLAITR